MEQVLYAWAFEADSMHFSGEHETIEECLKEARGSNYNNRKIVYIGIVVNWDSSIDTDQVIESIQCSAADYAGELAEDYLMHVPKERIEELDKELNKVFQKWKDKYSLNPTFFLVEEVKEYNLKTGEFLAYVN